MATRSSPGAASGMVRKVGEAPGFMTSTVAPRSSAGSSRDPEPVAVPSSQRSNSGTWRMAWLKTASEAGAGGMFPSRRMRSSTMRESMPAASRRACIRLALSLQSPKRRVSTCSTG